MRSIGSEGSKPSARPGKEADTWAPRLLTFFQCSTQLSMEFQLLIKSKMLKKYKKILAFKLPDVVFIMLINVKMPTIVCILTFFNRIHFCSVELSSKKFCKLGSRPRGYKLFHAQLC